VACTNDDTYLETEGIYDDGNKKHGHAQRQCSRVRSPSWPPRLLNDHKMLINNYQQPSVSLIILFYSVWLELWCSRTAGYNLVSLNM
jgi:hypothetical protein